MEIAYFMVNPVLRLSDNNLRLFSFKLYIRKIKFASLILQTQFYYLYYANRPVGNFSLLSQDFFRACSQKLRKATISSRSAFSSAFNNAASTGRISTKFDIWLFSENMSK
jgi:hypothetical protein